MKIALCQSSPDFGEIKKNVNDVVNLVNRQEFDILVLPELFATGYQFKNRSEVAGLADDAGRGYTFESLRQLSAEKKGLIVYGFPERRGAGLYNSAMAVMPDGSYHIYQKTHLFDTEKEIFDPGESGFFVFTFRNARVGVMICFDWRFPESARKLALLGAQIICHPANLVLPHCPQAMVIRALENNVFIITSDRVGEEARTGDKLKFIGQSRIIAPDGKVLGELGESKTGWLSVDITPELADDKTVTARNDLFKDRRPEYY